MSELLPYQQELLDPSIDPAMAVLAFVGVAAVVAAEWVPALQLAAVAVASVVGGQDWLCAAAAAAAPALPGAARELGLVLEKAYAKDPIELDDAGHLVLRPLLERRLSYHFEGYLLYQLHLPALAHQLGQEPQTVFLLQVAPRQLP